MKKVLFGSILGLFMSTGVFAQSNTLLVYGSAGYESRDNFNFSPAVGYQWNNNWTGGVNFNLGETSGRYEMGAGPFIRYTYPISDLFIIYGQFDVNGVSVRTENDRTGGFRGTLFPAVGMNIKNGFALNFGFGGLTVSTFDPKFKISFGTGLNFGISKNFGLR